MDIDVATFFGPHGLKMIFLKSKKEGFCNFDKAILIDENLLSCEALMADTIGI